MYDAQYFTGDSDSPLVRTETTNWQVVIADTAVDGAPIVCPLVTGTEVRTMEAGDHPRVVTTEYEYDAVGNVTRERRSGTAPAGDDAGAPIAGIAVTTETTYAQNDTSHVVDRVARLVRRDNAGRLIGEVRHYYDGPDLSGLPLGQVGAGLLRRQEEIVLPAADLAALYGDHEPDWATLGYHDTTTADGVAAIAVDHTRYEYSAFGMIVRKLDALDGETRFAYDADGLLVVEMTNAVGHVRTATYDTGWQLIEEHTLANGSAIRYRYDGLGRLVALIQPDDAPEQPTIRYVPDHSSSPASVRTERRRRSGEAGTYDETVYFDGRGRELQRRTVVDTDRVRVSGVVRTNRRGDAVLKGEPQYRTGQAYEPDATLPATPASTYAYDAVGRLVLAVNPEHGRCEVAYTPWTATIADVIDTDPADPRRDTPRIQHFDPFGRLAAVELVAEGDVRHRASYTYDAMGRLVASTDLEGRPALRSVVYDGRGLRLSIKHAVAGHRTAVYDGRGRLVAYWDSREVVVARTYDAIGRLLTESVDGVVHETYHYDESPDQAGRLARVDDDGGSVVFAYDAMGRVIGKDRSVLGASFTIGYDYEPTGVQRGVTYPDGTVITFDRRGDGRVRSVSGLVDDIDYDGAGRMVELDHHNGVTETFGYTAAGHLETTRVASGGQALYDVTVSHDGAGRVTGVDGTFDTDPLHEAFQHDALGHLTQFARVQGATTTTWDYTTDADGNLLASAESDTARFDYDFTEPGALVSRTQDDGSVESFGFDVAGHMTQASGATLEWDARGRLTRFTKAATTVTFVYDYRGARVAKQVTDGTGTMLTRYVDELYEDRAGVGNGYVFAAGRLVGRLRGAGRRHVHVDHRGSVILVTTAAGVIDGRGWFGPYGRVVANADPDGGRAMAGLVLDGETGLYYCNQRYFSPAIGRFLSPDPRYLAQPERELDSPEAHNLYVYAGADPVDFVDPTGEGFWSTLGQILAGIVVVVAVVAAIVVVAWLIGSGGWLLLAGAAIGALIGLAVDGWEGMALGAMMGATIGINVAIGGPLGLITFMGVFPGIRKQDWYHSLAGWSSWFMPASWPGHILGLGVFLANGIAHVFGSDNKIESVKFDWKHGQILTAGGEYGGTPFPWLGMSGPSHSLGGFAFWSNKTWEEGGKSWKGIETMVDPGRGYAHETGHMLSNALFGFWQGVINGIENLTTSEHDDRLFEKIAQSNVPEADRDPGDQVIGIWT
jgi:RHS repeat-associated protein